VGYDLLEKKLMEEKLKRLKETSFSDDVISPPSLVVDMRNES